MSRHFLPALCALVAVLCLASVGRTAVLNLAPGQEGAIWTAKAGDTVVLQPGTYPPFRLSGKAFDPPLTIEAAGATLDGWYWLNIDGLVLKGAAVKGVFRIDNARRVRLEAITSDGATVLLSGGGDNAISGLTTRGGPMGFAARQMTGLTVENINCTAMTGDCIQLTGVAQARVSGVVSRGSVPADGAHPDAVQTVSLAGWPLRDITIENVDVDGATQGVLLDVGEGYVVRNLRARTGYVHALLFSGGSAEVSGVAVSTLPGSQYQARVTLQHLSSLKVTGPVTVAAYGTSTGWVVPLTVTSPPVAVEPAPAPVPAPEPAPAPDPRDAKIAALEAQVATLSGRVDALTAQLTAAQADRNALAARIDALLIERAKALALAKQARAAKAKNQYLDPLVALLSAPAP